MENINDNKQKSSEQQISGSEDKIKNIETKLFNIFKKYGCLNDIGDISDYDLAFFKDLSLTVNGYFSQKHRQ